MSDFYLNLLNISKILIMEINVTEMKYYMFDWDDNILFMPTVIHTEKLVNNKWIKHDVSTGDFREIRRKIVSYYETGQGEYRYPDNDPDKAYLEFRDHGERGDNAFYLDSMKSLSDEKYGEAWNDLIECLVGGHLFMIITARGHEPKSIRIVIEHIINNILTEEQFNNMINSLKLFNKVFNSKSNIDNSKTLINNYLNLCEFIGINSDYFMDKFDMRGQSINPEKFKSVAIEYFVSEMFKYKRKNNTISVGFSDDDTGTVQYVNKFIKNELSLKYPMEYFTYDTKDGKIKKKF